LPRLLIPLLFLVLLCLPSCQSTPADKLAFKTLNSSWDTIGVEYVGYVETDGTLTADQKTAKRLKAGEITKLLAERSKS
jgi:hypothetical protein